MSSLLTVCFIIAAGFSFVAGIDDDEVTLYAQETFFEELGLQSKPTDLTLQQEIAVEGSASFFANPANPNDNNPDLSKAPANNLFWFVFTIRLIQRYEPAVAHSDHYDVYLYVNNVRVFGNAIPTWGFSIVTPDDMDAVPEEKKSNLESLAKAGLWDFLKANHAAFDQIKNQIKSLRLRCVLTKIGLKADVGELEATKNVYLQVFGAAFA